MMTSKHILIILALAVVLVGVGFVAGWNIARDSSQPSQRPEPDTIVRVDIITRTSPPDTVEKVKWKPKYIPDTAWFELHDSIFVELPYEQHHLSVPDTFDLWYSGIDARVDSLRYYSHNTTIEVHDVMEMPRQCFSLYGGVGGDWFDGGYSYKVFLEAQVEMGRKFVVSADGGLGVIEKTATPYVGVTLKYKLN